MNLSNGGVVNKFYLTAPKVILFDWHATLVDTFAAMYHAIDDVLAKFDRLGLLTQLTNPERSKTIEDAKLVEYVRSQTTWFKSKKSLEVMM